MMEQRIFFGKKIYTLFFVLLVLIQISICFYLGTQKQDGGFIDEVYTYILSNSYDTDRFSNEPKFFNDWVSSRDFMELITVQKGERFAYDKVFYNNSLDAHPPFYYCLIHTVCSFFTNRYSKWFGLLLNFIFLLVADIALFKVSLYLLKSDFASLCVCILWGFSLVCFDTTMLIRQYSLLTMLSVLLFYINIKILNEKFTLKLMVSLFLVSFCGIFTQHFFTILAFFLSLFMCLIKIKRKQFKDFIIYGSIMLFSVACLFIFFPAAYTQITGSKTNNIGNELSKTVTDFSTLPRKVFARGLEIFKFLFSWTLVKAGLCFFILIVILKTVKKLSKKSMITKNNEISDNKEYRLSSVSYIYSVVSLVFSFCAVCHFSTSYSTIRYHYNFYPLIALLVAWTYLIFVKDLFSKRVIQYILLFICLINSVLHLTRLNCAYIYKKRADWDKSISSFGKSNCVIINTNSKSSVTGQSTVIPTAALFHFQCFDKVFISKKDILEDFDSIIDDEILSNNLMVYIATDKYWMGGYDAPDIISEILGFSSFYSGAKYVQTAPFGEIYMLLSNGS